MQKVNIFANYSVLGHEKNTQFTLCAPIGVCYSKGVIYIPDQYPICRNSSGELLIEINGEMWLLQDVITSRKGKPYLCKCSAHGSAYIALDCDVETETHFSP